MEFEEDEPVTWTAFFAKSTREWVPRCGRTSGGLQKPGRKFDRVSIEHKSDPKEQTV